VCVCFSSLSDSFFPRYELEDNRQRLIQVIRHYMCLWTPQRHALFPPNWRERARCLAMCNSRCRREGRAWLPKDVLKARFPLCLFVYSHSLQVLLGWMAVAEAHNDNHLRNALESFRKENISDVLQDKGVAGEPEAPEEAPAPEELSPGGDNAAAAANSPRSAKGKKKKKKTKQDLVDEAVRRREEEDMRARLQQSSATTLPAVIGKLVGREETRLVVVLFVFFLFSQCGVV
jgi:hypothetical protein